MTDWMFHAACRLDPARMWDEERVLEAKQLCSVCPVLTECAEWELAQTEWVPGVVAGRDEMERSKRMRRCADCGRPGRHSTTSYCKKCGQARKRESYQRLRDVGAQVQTCRLCGGRFETTDPRKMYCTVEHRWEYRRRKTRLARTG